MDSNHNLLFGQTGGASAPEATMMAASKQSPPTHSPRRPRSKEIPCYCPFCCEVNLFKLFGRKADLGKHFKKSHQGNDIWVCPEPGCEMKFEWHSHFLSHQKTHSQTPSVVRGNEAAAKVKLLPRLVFGCGFSHCKYVGVAKDAEDSAKKTTEFFHHILNHFNEDIPLDWRYSVRLRNLMRSGRVNSIWKARLKNGEELEWQPHNTFVLRKTLETGHFSDSFLPELVHLAVISRSPPYCYPDSPTPGLYATHFTLPRVADHGTDYMSSSLGPPGATDHGTTVKYMEPPLTTSPMAGDGLGGSWMLLDNLEYSNPLLFTVQMPSMDVLPTDPVPSTSESQLSISGNGYYYYAPTLGSGPTPQGRPFGDYFSNFRQWWSDHPTSTELESGHQHEGDFSDEDFENYNSDSPDPLTGPQIDE